MTHSSQQTDPILPPVDPTHPRTLIERVLILSKGGKEGDAADELVSGLDDLLLRGQICQIQCLLEALPLDHIPPQAITGAMMVLHIVPNMLGPTWPDFQVRAEAALVRHHGWAPDRARATLLRYSM